MPHDARMIANEVLRRAWAMGYEPTQIDIQKIVYFLHGHHLKDHGEPLVAAPFQALQYGPVQTALLDAFRKFDAEPIRELALKFDPVRRVWSDFPALTDNAAAATIETYLPRYLEMDAFELVDRTHAPETPWSITVREARSLVNVGMRIDNALILARFEGVSA